MAWQMLYLGTKWNGGENAAASECFRREWRGSAVVCLKSMVYSINTTSMLKHE